MTGILSLFRLPSVLLVSLLLLGSAVTATAQTEHRTSKIAFASNRDGNFEIYTINSDGSDPVRLTQNPGVDNYPAWSPDGRMIAFIREIPGGLAIFRMNQDGTNQIQITPISIRAPLSWSPDGGRIAFQDRDSDPSRLRIFVVDSDGGNRRRVTNDSTASDSNPSWSPDGSRILFSRYVPPDIVYVYGGAVFHTIDPEGTDLRMLPHGFGDGFGDYMSSWSPMGDKIAFAVNVWDFVTNIYIANADGTDRRFFHGCDWWENSCRLDALDPQFSPDGDKIVFTMRDFFNASSQVFVKNIDGTGLTLLADSAQTPSWQPYVHEPVNSALDFDGNGDADILWRHTAGDVAIWLLDGSNVLSGSVIANVPTQWTTVGKADFNGDGHADILWRHSNGTMAIWFMNGRIVLSALLLPSVTMDWKVVGVGDFSGDAKADILWRHTAGDVGIWLMDGPVLSQAAAFRGIPNTWTISGVGDLNGDRKSDIVWRNNDGTVAVWLMDGLVLSQGAAFGAIPNTWTILGMGDLNGDGKSDMLWRNDDGTVAIWLMKGAEPPSGAIIENDQTTRRPVQIGDFNGDGKADIIWRQRNGDLAMWLMDGPTVLSKHSIMSVPPNWITR